MPSSRPAIWPDGGVEPVPDVDVRRDGEGMSAASCFSSVGAGGLFRPDGVGDGILTVRRPRG